jgi:hypothetical protein
MPLPSKDGIGPLNDDDNDLYRPALAPKGLYLYYLVTLHTFHPVPRKSPSIILLQFVALLCILFYEIS